MGAFMGRPVELVRCELSDLVVPATAEIVMEGYVSPDPETFEMEGPFAEYTGYIGGEPDRRHVIRVECITHRNDPIFRGTITGCLPGSGCENSVMSSVQRAAVAWNILEKQGVPGILDVFIHPVNIGTTVCVRIHKTYQGQAQQIAAALWGSGAAQFRYKNVFVADEDIDITSYEALDWAFAYRVDPDKDLVVFPGSFGSPLDPSVPLNKRDVSRLGSGLWNRLLIDATKNWELPRRPEWGDDVYPPTVRPAPEDERAVSERWEELGLADL
jgi:4-hydroxy-3-polyprenylbenzoate decarboxylase